MIAREDLPDLKPGWSWELEDEDDDPCWDLYGPKGHPDLIKSGFAGTAYEDQWWGVFGPEFNSDSWLESTTELALYFKAIAAAVEELG